MKTDSIFYQLFAFPSIFFDLIGRSTNETRGYQFRSVEIKQTAFRINGVFLPSESSPEKTVYFCEVQFQKDEFLYHRVFAELFLFLDQNPSTYDWYAVIIYPKRSLEPHPPAPSPQAERGSIFSPIGGKDSLFSLYQCRESIFSPPRLRRAAPCGETALQAGFPP